MDAIALSFANEYNAQSVTLDLAAGGIVIGALANAIFKTGLRDSPGHASIRNPLLVGMLPMMIAGIIGFTSFSQFWPGSGYSSMGLAHVINYIDKPNKSY